MKKYELSEKQVKDIRECLLFKKATIDNVIIMFGVQEENENEFCKKLKKNSSNLENILSCIEL